MRIEVTPHTRSLSNFSEFTYTVLQAGSISEKSCAQVVASPRYSETLEAYAVRDCTARALGTLHVGTRLSKYGTLVQCMH